MYATPGGVLPQATQRVVHRKGICAVGSSQRCRAGTRTEPSGVLMHMRSRASRRVGVCECSPSGRAARDGTLGPRPSYFVHAARAAARTVAMGGAHQSVRARLHEHRWCAAGAGVRSKRVDVVTRATVDATRIIIMPSSWRSKLRRRRSATCSRSCAAVRTHSHATRRCALAHAPATSLRPVQHSFLAPLDSRAVLSRADAAAARGARRRAGLAEDAVLYD